MVPNFVKRGNQREVGKVFFNGSGAIYESGEPDPFAASSINCGGGRAGGGRMKKKCGKAMLGFSEKQAIDS
jgi:hypothetical protein